ncbi:MAG: hypothetical protein KAQ93_00100 [Spirochaetales bacterium]|nr:hypothetical protein [Spirochaetales bacterium]
MEIKEEEYLEKRIVLFKGEEIRRFEYLNEGDIIIIREYEGNNLIYVEKKKNGLVLKEEYYKNNVLINEYIYEWSGRQLHKTTYNENKILIYEDHFILGENGEIRQIRRFFTDGQLSTSGFSNVYQQKSYEWYGTEREFTFYKYAEDRVVEVENWQNGKLNRTKIYTISESGTIVTETDLLTGKINKKIFDLNDNLISESSRNGSIVERITYFYNDNLLIQKEVASSGKRIKYFYDYDVDKKIQLERIFKDEMLIKEILYKQGKKILEKLYKDNSLILIVTYKNGEKISEEYIQ